VNRLRGGLKVAVKAPGWRCRKAMLEDIAT
jgi:hypothetical protein